MTQDTATGGAERRRHVRHPVNLKKSLHTAAGETPIMDISWGGVCFFSATPLPKETEIEFFAQHLTVGARVLGCEKAQGELANAEYPFQVRCVFLAGPEDPSISALMEHVLDEQGIGGHN